MTKGLFTSLEEIKFQYNYVQGNAQKICDSNTKKKPQKCIYSKKQNKKMSYTFSGHTR